MDSILTRSDHEAYWLRLYFGSKHDLDPLGACIDRAYLDFSRTAHGLGKVENSKALRDEAAHYLKGALAKLENLATSQIDSTAFDDWHETICQKLIAVYHDHGYTLFVGQAQKWVNMTLKYVFLCFAFGENRLAGFEAIYANCHIPLDNVILNELLEDYKEFPALPCAWSRLDNYGEYLKRQEWIRQSFVCAPLDVEFLLWLERKGEVRYLFRS